MKKDKVNLLKYSEVILDTPGNTIDPSSTEHRIVVMDKQECIFLKTKTICYIEADGAYSNIYLTDRRKLVVSKNIKVFDEKLPDSSFCRIHKSFLINLAFISKYVKSEGGYIIMENGASIPVSVRKRDTLLQLVEALSL
jgi:two-component system, LytTR family, response regulator